MPMVNDNGTGRNESSAAQTSILQPIVLTGEEENPSHSVDLLVRGMPRVQFYCLQTLGDLASTFVPEFSVADTDEGERRYLPLSVPIAIPLNVPVLVPYDLSTKLIRASFQAPAGQATEITLVMMAAL
jgi:hypothetical protein